TWSIDSEQLYDMDIIACMSTKFAKWVMDDEWPALRTFYSIRCTLWSTVPTVWKKLYDSTAHAIIAEYAPSYPVTSLSFFSAMRACHSAQNPRGGEYNALTTLTMLNKARRWGGFDVVCAKLFVFCANPHK